MLPILEYDAILRLEDTTKFKIVQNAVKDVSKTNLRTQITNKIVEVLQKGLNKRCTRIVPLFIDELKSQDSLTTILLGVSLNQSEAFSMIEKGPPGNVPEAFEFRKFWGKLSELRRFADGSVIEAVYFSSKSVYEKRQIFQRIVNYLLKEKLGIEEVKIIGNEFEQTLLTDSCRVETCEEATVKIITLFDELSKILRNLKISSPIMSVHNISEIFCYTHPFPPKQGNYQKGNNKFVEVKDNVLVIKSNATFVPKFIESIECVLHTEKNSKWPDELEAFRAFRTIFFIEIIKQLETLEIKALLKETFIDVLYKGIVFRFYLYHTKEIQLLKKYTKPNGALAFKHNKESIDLEKKMLIQPRIVDALRGLHSQFPSFGPSCCLIKRFIRTQLIDECYLPDLLIDLLNASLYLKYETSESDTSAPSLPQLAFLRFLYHFGQFKFLNQYVTVNFNNDLSAEQLDTFEDHFNKYRNEHPPICILTPYDDGKSLFSRGCSAEISNKLCALANIAFKFVKANILEKKFNLKYLYNPNFGDFDALIHLKSRFIAKRYQELCLDKSSKLVDTMSAYKDNNEDLFPIINFDVVSNYLKILRDEYKEIAEFYFNSYGGSKIGIMWKKEAISGLNFPPFSNSTELVRTEIEIEDILSQFFIHGRSIVSSIEDKGWKVPRLNKSFKEDKILSLYFDEEIASPSKICIKKADNYVDEISQECTLLIEVVPPLYTKQCLINAFSKIGGIKNVIFQKREHAEENVLGYKKAYIIFKSPEFLNKCLQLENLNNCQKENNPVLMGFKKYVSDYSSCFCNIAETEAKYSKYFKQYERSAKNKKVDLEEEDGWTVISRKGRKPGTIRKESVETRVLNKLKTKFEKKCKSDFYTFQLKECKQKNLQTMKEKFDNEKLKVKSKTRRFKPY